MEAGRYLSTPLPTPHRTTTALQLKKSLKKKPAMYHKATCPHTRHVQARECSGAEHGAHGARADPMLGPYRGTAGQCGRRGGPWDLGSHGPGPCWPRALYAPWVPSPPGLHVAEFPRVGGFGVWGFLGFLFVSWFGVVCRAKQVGRWRPRCLGVKMTLVAMAECLVLGLILGLASGLSSW